MARLSPADAPPPWAWAGEITSITRTPDELSVVCAEDAVPPQVRCERGWRALAVRGPIPFDQTGVIASLVGPLAAAAVAVFTLATYDTDVVLVKEVDLARALDVLRTAGHAVDA